MTVTASDGNGNEATETVVITVTSGNSVSVPSTVTVAEAAGNAEIAITTTAAFGKALTFSVSYGGTSAMGASAPADGDYDNDEVASVAFSATDTTIKITVPITDDTLDENDETFTVTIELAGGSELPAGFTLGNAMTTVTITDDDTLSTSWTLSAVPSTVTEVSGTTAVKVTATRAGTATAASSTTLTISVAGGTATAGQDFTAVNDFDLIVAAGAASGEASFSLAVSDDSVDESDETAAVSGTLAGNNISGATITITDNDEAGVTVTGSPVAVTEGETGTYTVALDSQPTGSVTVTPTSGDTNAATVSGALTFTTGNWSTAQTVTVTGVQDADGDDDTVSVTHAATGGGYVSVSIDAVTVNVADDDAVQLGKSQLTLVEGTTGTYTVVLASKPGGSVTVTPESDDKDVATVSGALTFTTDNWSAAQTVTVTGVENSVAGVGSSATVSHGVQGYGTVTAGGVTVTVTDNDSAGVTVSATGLTVVEGATGTYTVRLNTKPGGNVTVTPTSSPLTVATVSAALTFTTDNWDAVQTVTVTGVNNELDAADGSATVSHGVTGYGLVTTAMSVSVSVTDDDESPVLASLADVTLKLGQAVDITAEATDGDGDTVSFAWTRKAGETPALPIGVVLPLSGSRLSFTPTAVGTYTMTVTASDGYNEDTETVVITVTPANAVSVPTALTVGEGAGNAEVTITTAAVFGKALTFSVSYGGTSAMGASAPADGDYDNDEVTSVAFSAAETTKKITVPITDDTLDENDETFTVTIELAGGSELPAGFTLGNTATTVTITDDDTLSTNWTLSADPDSVAESRGTAKVKVTALRSGEATSAALTTVRVSVAGGTATAGIDFMGVSPFDITIAIGKKSGEAAFTLTIIDDNPYENDETITVNGALAGNTITGTGITLTNDSDKPELSIAAPDAVAEGDSGNTDMVFTVTLDGQSQRQTTVDYAVDARSTASASGDYTGGAGTLTFAAGTTQKKITVAIRGDKSDEEDETVVIKLLNPDNATVATTATASGTIADDDASPVLAAIDTVSKRVGQLVSVTASATDADRDTITYAWTRKSGETVPALPDTPLDKATLTFTPTEAGTYTMTVTASDGNGNEDSETVAITVTSASAVSVPEALTVSEDAGTATVKATVDRAFGERVDFQCELRGRRHRCAERERR